MKSHIHYDLIIVGAGLVGSSLALALKNSGLKILCLDRRPLLLENELLQDKRPISLSYASVCILKNLKIWHSLEKLATAIQKVHVSNQGGFGRLEFKASDYELPALGYVVPFVELERALLKGAFQDAHCGYLEIKEMSNLKCHELGAELEVLREDGVGTLTAQLLVAADGTYSRVRELLRIKTEQETSKEIAFTARIHLQKTHQNVAYERFSSEGTFALLPSVEPHVVNLVWTLPETEWELWRYKSEQELLQQLQKIFGYRLGKMLNLEVMAYYPLSMMMAQAQISPGAVLLGNAAHSFYPLAAQGFNLGLRDAAALSEVLLVAQKNAAPLGKLQLLESYQAQRSEDQRAVANLTKVLHQAFSLKIPGAACIRSLALLGIDLLPPLKRNLAKRCLGFAGRVSTLVRALSWP